MFLFGSCMLCFMIEFHRKMLADGVRNAAFVKALKKVIVPGKSVVADIGSGTGFLAFIASSLGAKECFLYETGDVLELSKKIAQENGINNCHFIRKHSATVKTPPRADIVISETLGNFALEEHILENLRDAKRFLKQDGVMIPQKIRQYVVPVTSDTIFREVQAWNDVDAKINFAAAKEMSVNNLYVRTVAGKDLYSGPDAMQQWDTIDLLGNEKSKRAGDVSWTVNAPETIHGFCLFWECDLLPGVTLSTSPSAPLTHWEQLFLPVPQPIALKKGESLSLTIQSDSSYNVGINVMWDVESPSGKWGMDMRKGHLN